MIQIWNNIFGTASWQLEGMVYQQIVGIRIAQTVQHL